MPLPTPSLRFHPFVHKRTLDPISHNDNRAGRRGERQLPVTAGLLYLPTYELFRTRTTRLPVTRPVHRIRPGRPSRPTLQWEIGRRTMCSWPWREMAVIQHLHDCSRALAPRVRCVQLRCPFLEVVHDLILPFC